MDTAGPPTSPAAHSWRSGYSGIPRNTRRAA